MSRNRLWLFATTHYPGVRDTRRRGLYTAMRNRESYHFSPRLAFLLRVAAKHPAEILLVNGREHFKKTPGTEE